MSDWLWLLVPVPALLVVAFREGLRHVDRQQERRTRAVLAHQAEAARQREYDADRTAYWLSRLDATARRREMER